MNNSKKTYLLDPVQILHGSNNSLIEGTVLINKGKIQAFGQEALTQGKRIEIRGFGSFFTKTREKRIGINPQNGKNIEIEKKVHPKFKMGKILFKKLNPK